MKRFARAVCDKPEVICGTYADLVKFLERKDTRSIASYQKGDFQKAAVGSINLPIIPKRVGYIQEELTSKELDALREELKNMKHGEDIKKGYDI